MHVKTVYPVSVSFLLVFHGYENSCMWLGDSSWSWSFLPLGLALAFCPLRDSLSSVVYRPNLQALLFQVMRVVWNPAVCSESIPKFCLSSTFLNVNSYFFFSLPSSELQPTSTQWTNKKQWQHWRGGDLSLQVWQWIPKAQRLLDQ